MAKKSTNKKKKKIKIKKAKTQSVTKLDLSNHSKANFVKMLIGDNATGKTTTEIRIAKVWARQNPKGHIIAYDPTGKIKEAFGHRLIAIHPNDISSLESVQKLSNCLFIIDDTLMFLNNTNRQEIINLLSCRRVKDCDFIFSVHNATLLNKIYSIVMFVTDYYIFPTLPYHNDDYKSISNYVLVSKAVEIINLYHKIWGREYSFFNYLQVNGSGITASSGIDGEKLKIVIELLEMRRRAVEEAIRLQESENEATIKKQTTEEINNES